MELIIEKLTVEPSLDGMTNVVRDVHWRATESGQGKTAHVYGVVNLGEPSPGSFVDFSELTQPIVGQWMVGAGWVEHDVQQTLDRQLAALQSPQVETTPPWAG